MRDDKSFRLKTVTLEDIARAKANTTAAGWPVAKWMLFCEWAIQRGLIVEMYAAKSTVSKYIYLSPTLRGPK